MKNTGYVALGHLLALKKLSAEYDSKKTLRNFLSVLFGRMNETKVNSSTGFWRFDQFFENVEPNTENMAKFLRGILKQPHVDDHTFELEVERIVWDMVKFGYDRFCTKVLSREDYFRLFCIFNRLCDAETLLLGKRTISFLFAKFVQTPLEEFEGTFRNIGDIVCSWQRNGGGGRHNENYKIIIKKMYDDYVRDIIIESRVKLRLPFKTQMYGKGTILKKTISITSRKLIVYEDDVDGLKNLDVPSKQEPTGKIIHEMSLVSAETKISPESKGLFASRSKKFDVLAIRSGPGTDTGIDIVFDTGKEIYDVYAWTNAIKESEDLINASSSRLIQLKEELLQEHGIDEKESIYENQDIIDGAHDSTMAAPIVGLYRYSDMPFPPKKPARKSLKSSLKRKSRSLEKLNDNKETQTPRNTPINPESPFHFSEFEQSNVLGFLRVSAESGDVEEGGVSDQPALNESAVKHEMPKVKKIPPSKPVRKMISTPMSSSTALKKRFQDQYVDVHTQKTSNSENKETRSKSVSDFSGNEPDLILSCYKKKRHKDNQSSSSVTDESIKESLKENEQEEKEDAEVFESPKQNEMSQHNSADDLAERFSTMMVESFTFDDDKVSVESENKKIESRKSSTRSHSYKENSPSNKGSDDRQTLESAETSQNSDDASIALDSSESNQSVPFRNSTLSETADNARVMIKWA